MKKKLLPIFFIIFLLIIYILLCINSYVNAVSNNISSSVFRLHVIANSDSVEDQSLKYKVRDKILEYTNTLIDVNSNSKEEVINIVNQNIAILKQVAQNTVYENGFNYNVNISIGNFYFPTKYYGDISLPAGYYDALRVEIGNAKGQNWWCVMFPPLCFVDVTSGIVPDDSKENLQENLPGEEYDLISSDSEEIQFKFKLVEIFENLKETIANKN